MPADVAKRPTCDCCDNELSFRWFDLHGVGACTTCGMPYRIYHYEGEGDERKSVSKPPELMLKDEVIPLAREYWSTFRSRVFPAIYDMGFTERDGRSFSGATPEEERKFQEWFGPKWDAIAPKAGVVQI